MKMEFHTTTRLRVFLLLPLLFAATWACNFGTRQMTADASQSAASPSTVAPIPSEKKSRELLIGKWKDDSTGQIVEYTTSEFILYDFPAPDNKLFAKYTLLDDHTIQLDIEGSMAATFDVTEDKLTITNQDGTILVYSRIK